MKTTSITESSTQRQSVTTGGSTSSKATQRTYEIGDINDANAQINNVLAPLGMRTFNAARLEAWLKGMVMNLSLMKCSINFLVKLEIWVQTCHTKTKQNHRYHYRCRARKIKLFSAWNCRL